MKERLNEISSYITNISDVQIVEAFKADFDKVFGKITVSVEGVTLEFAVEILNSYPYRLHDTETIRFINRELLSYNHVNIDGSICVHTVHHRELQAKLKYDFDSLKKWITNYYINKDKDLKYEHIVVQANNMREKEACFLFTNVDYFFMNGNFGSFNYAHFSTNTIRTKSIEIYLIKNFKISGEDVIPNCKWSENWQNTGHNLKGIFYFSSQPPVYHGRFILEKWSDLENYLSQDFLKFLYSVKKSTNFKKLGIKEIPFLLGYPIPNGEIHWQTAFIDVNSFPNYSEKLPNNEGFIGRLTDESINWNTTKNCSYNYFFGRGKFCNKLTDKKILIFGLGAIGSIVSTTLTRGGCRFLSLCDFDIKEPENVCRSEYNFQSGIGLKTDELASHLTHISPFVKINISDKFSDLIKLVAYKDEFLKNLKIDLSSYDFIIDCTADNDFLNIIDKIKPETEVISISITNNAESLIFGAGNDIYDWINSISEQLKGEDLELYEPTGCWSPTFKASYNDVNVLVQYALKQLNYYLTNDKSINKFYLKTDLENGFHIKLHEF